MPLPLAMAALITQVYIFFAWDMGRPEQINPLFSGPSSVCSSYHGCPPGEDAP